VARAETFAGGSPRSAETVALLDAEVTTIESLGKDGALHPLQETFIRHDAFQCGYCTPGPVLTAMPVKEEIPCRKSAGAA
jgi:aerobic-type carbon monoxide dehydrogenase small subunit (CoxS/CutS family)